MPYRSQKGQHKVISTRQAEETHRETWDHYANNGGERVRGRARDIFCEEVENLVAYGLGFVARTEYPASTDPYQAVHRSGFQE